ncbi:MAG: DUF192 domain-containing protein [Bdellovibrionia bacterium]
MFIFKYTKILGKKFLSPLEKTKKLNQNPSWRLLFGFIPWTSWLLPASPPAADQSQLLLGFSHQPECRLIYKKTRAQVAIQAETMARGLSLRKNELSKQESMIFIYPDQGMRSFWMKRTLIPLQIAFFNAQGHLLRLEEMAVEQNPENPTRLYSSDSTQAVIELRPGSLTQKKGPTYLCVFSE